MNVLVFFCFFFLLWDITADYVLFQKVTKEKSLPIKWTSWFLASSCLTSNILPALKEFCYQNSKKHESDHTPTTQDPQYILQEIGKTHQTT